MTAVDSSLSWLMSGVLMPVWNSTAYQSTARHSTAQDSTTQHWHGKSGSVTVCREQHFVAWHCLACSCRSSSVSSYCLVMTVSVNVEYLSICARVAAETADLLPINDC